MSFKKDPEKNKNKTFWYNFDMYVCLGHGF